MYASLLRISGALHLGIFDQPEESEFFNKLFIFDFIKNSARNIGEVSSLVFINMSEVNEVNP